MSSKYYSPLAEREYRAMIEAPEKFPVSFNYNGKTYHGFSREDFVTCAVSTSVNGARETTTCVFGLENTLKITVDAGYYADYGMYDWTVWFENVSDKNSDVLENVCGADLTFQGEHPVLKGILGDHVNRHAPYEYDLMKQPVHFENTIGRATHITFPYFYLLCGDSGATLSIGWGGTWKADFMYQDGMVHFCGDGTYNFASYLKPGEKVRTALITVARFAGRDTAFAVNQRRKWYFDYWMPRENGDHIQPFTTSCLSSDTGKPNSDGSISESWETWKPTLEKIYQENLRVDYRWIDAGWYFDANQETVPIDWWGTVGTWEIDAVKWPGDTLRESVDYAMAHGSRTLLWFEPERVCKVNALAKNYGYNPKWALGDDQVVHDYHGVGTSLNNLGDPECLDWTFNRIIQAMDKSGVHMYREDFNMEPAPFWKMGDEAQGTDRTGITENLYMQGHYELWDRIIADCIKKGKTPFVDICASGGGRNDMESLRRGIPLLRSDQDRTITAHRLSMTTSLGGWIPFAGAHVKESIGELDSGKFDEYIWRCSMQPVYNYSFEHTHDPSVNYDNVRRSMEGEWKNLAPYLLTDYNTQKPWEAASSVNYDDVRRSLKEWEQIAPYLCADFYTLTPWHAPKDKTGWTAFAYYDEERESGVLQIFRQEEAQEDTYTFSLPFVEEDSVYELTDIDGKHSVSAIDGRQLKKGWTMTLENPRTAVIIYVRKK